MLQKWSVLACLLGVIATSAQADTPAVVTDSVADAPESHHIEVEEARLTAGLPVIVRILDTFADQPPDVRWRMVVIAYCESTGWIHRLPNGELRPHETGKSTTRGVLQVLAGLHGPELERRGLDLENDDHYFEFVRQLFDQPGDHGGVAPWASSRTCLEGEKGMEGLQKARELLAEAAGEYGVVSTEERAR